MSAWWSISRRRGRERGRGRGWSVLIGALLGLMAAGVLRVHTGERRERVHFPRVPPAHLAHLLADFSGHPHAAAGPRSWRLVEERGNYTSWWYSVSFECGSGCAGEAYISAAGTRRRTDRHLVSQRISLCTTLPLVPWLFYCDELEMQSAVWASEAGTGSVVEERAVARCGAARVLVGACARELDAYRDAHRAALAARILINGAAEL